MMVLLGRSDVRRLTYLNDCYFDPTTGVFTSVDPLVGRTGTPPTSTPTATRQR